MDLQLFSLFPVLAGLLFGFFVLNVVWPNALEGLIVRLEAQYDARESVELDPETDERTYAPTTQRSYVTSAWGEMLGRVLRIEGWQGPLRGLWPMFLAKLVELAVGSLVVRVCGPKPRTTFIVKNFLQKLAIAPFRIIAYQAITTPEKLSFFDIKRAMHVFLSPSERRRPWLIYLTPGVVSIVLFEAVYVLALPSIGRSMLRFSKTPFLYIFTPHALVRSGYAVVSTTILTPVHVMFVRLAIQRNHTRSRRPPPGEEDTVHAEKEPSWVKAQVMDNLRTEKKPYAGVWDCAKTIVAEEGFGTFYRTWWYLLIMNWHHLTYIYFAFLIRTLAIIIWPWSKRSLRTSRPTSN